jgi:hypothetical protein
MTSVIVQLALQSVKVVDSWRTRHGFMQKALSAFRHARDSACGRHVVTAPEVDGRITILKADA